jgi:hypothetical protein
VARMRMYTEFSLKDIMEEYLGDLGIDGRIMLKRV